MRDSRRDGRGEQAHCGSTVLRQRASNQGAVPERGSVGEGSTCPFEVFQASVLSELSFCGLCGLCGQCALALRCAS